MHSGQVMFVRIGTGEEEEEVKEKGGLGGEFARLS